MQFCVPSLWLSHLCMNHMGTYGTPFLRPNFGTFYSHKARGDKHTDHLQFQSSCPRRLHSAHRVYPSKESIATHSSDAHHLGQRGAINTIIHGLRVPT